MDTQLTRGIGGVGIGFGESQTFRNAARVAASCRIGALSLLCCCLAIHASAQGGGGLSPNPSWSNGTDLSPQKTDTYYQVHSDETLVRLFAFAEDGKTHLDRQAVMKVTDLTTRSVKWQATDEKSEGALGLPFGKYELELSAVGYLTQRKEIEVTAQHITIRVEFALRRDPSAVDFNIADETLPPKARGDVKHAVSALKSGNLKDAKKRLDAAYKLAPSNPDLNFLMGYLFFEQKDLAQAASFLQTAANLSTHNVRVLTLLGHVQLIQENYVAAAETLEKAVAVNSGYWTAHNLLANAYFRLKRYDGAREEAELAIAQGKAGAGTANLVLGESLVNLGKKEEALRALKAFVQSSPSDPAVPQVRDLIIALERHDSGPLPSTEIVQKGETPSSDLDALYAAPELPVSVNPWRPPGVDESNPPVADGVNCPLSTVIDMSGQRVKDLVDNVSRIAAIEGLVHEQVNEMGNPASKEIRNYDYVATIAEDKGGGFAVSEYRSERMTRANFPDGIASNGFAVLALVFHPSMRENFDMVCEGLGRWHGQATWLVHFKQRENRPARHA